MHQNNKKLKISYVNIKGQTGLPLYKQFQIENFIKINNSDIVHFQEINIANDTFEKCNYITANFNILCNNASNGYGTASLVKNSLVTENVKLDTEGRIILFDIGKVSFCNVYLHSGTDGESKANREKLLAEVLPQLMTNGMRNGALGGDFNCILDKKDATNNQEQKISSSLKRFVTTFNLSDSFRSLYPNQLSYSRYYEVKGVKGASRIDRQYTWGNVHVTDASYSPLAFSDHLSHVVEIELNESLSLITPPRGKPNFKIREEVARDLIFQERISQAMDEWNQIKECGLDVLP